MVTRPDKRRRREGEPEPSPVKAAALQLGLPVSEDPGDLVGVGAELGVVVAYGRIIAPELLAVLPMVNLHFSLLPRWRGAAPVERAVLAGDEVTGVCLMEVVDELDAGGVYARAEVPIGPDATLDSLRATLVDEGTRLLLDGLAHGLGEPEPQVGEVVYAEKLTADDLRLDWSLPALDLLRRVRLGGAWTTFRGKRLKVHAAQPLAGFFVADPGTLDGTEVATGEGWLELLEVQPEGKGRQSATAWANGARLQPGDRFE